jgi:hypothetical protein
MKPIVIIAIAVVCSVVAMVGVLAIFVGINDIETKKQNDELQEYYSDLDIAQSYKIQYDEIWFNTCMNEPPALTYDKAERQAEKARSVVEYIARMQLTLEDLDNGMDILSKKYPNNDYFEFELIPCPYEEEWNVVSDALRDYQREITGELTTEQTDKVTMYVSNQYEKCIEENNTKFICNAKLGEYTEQAKLVLGYN